MPCSEVSALLQEVNDSKAALAEAHRAVEAREKEMAKMQTTVRRPPPASIILHTTSGLMCCAVLQASALTMTLSGPGGPAESELGQGQGADGGPSCRSVRETLFSQWSELKTPAAERVEALVRPGCDPT